MWTLAQITAGFEGIESFRTGRHVCFSIVNGRVRVIGEGNLTAILTLDAAKQHLRTVRHEGRPVPCRRDLGIKWDRLRGGRRFDMVVGRFDVAA